MACWRLVHRSGQCYHLCKILCSVTKHVALGVFLFGGGAAAVPTQSNLQSFTRYMSRSSLQRETMRRSHNHQSLAPAEFNSHQLSQGEVPAWNCTKVTTQSQHTDQFTSAFEQQVCGHDQACGRARREHGPSQGGQARDCRDCQDHWRRNSTTVRQGFHANSGR